MTTTDALAVAQRAPTASHLRSFALLSVLYALITAAVLPWENEAGPAEQNVAVVYGIGILVADLCTAVLLGALYLGTGRAALLVLACAYLYGGLMAGAHMATFAGALFPEPLFGNRQSVTWLFAAWRGGMAAFFLAAVLVASRDKARHPARHQARRVAWLLAACALAAAAAVALAFLVARRLPVMPLGEVVGMAAAIQWAALGVCAAAYALVWRGRGLGDVLYLWLGLVLLASMATLALDSLSAASYTVGWYASRANLVVSSCLLLAFLLGDLVQEERLTPNTSMVAAYGGAVAVTLGAYFLRWFLDPWLGNAVPYAVLYGAVAIAVWLGGLGPAVLAMVLGYIIVNVRYISPDGTLSIDDPADFLALGLFALSSSLVIVLGEAMRRARDRYRASELEVKARALQLQRQDAKKSEFLAVLSHELRNPLAPLRTGLALLGMKPVDADTRETHGMMERQIAQLARLIDDLLDVSRIDRGKLEMRRVRTPLAGVLQTAVDTARPNIDAKDHMLRLRLPAESLYVMGDPVRLAQVVSNLLNNAAKFTPRGGRIELTARAEEEQAVVSVADNGIGIDPARLPEVFDMFVQLDASHASAAGGLGLGLTLARSIVERHGGTIEARSAGAGRGAEFIVRVPLTSAQADAEPEARAPAPARSWRRVLVVDDNVDAAQTLADYLRTQGHRVESAVDGEAALRIAEVLHPEVAFIDLNMPQMDGIEVARRLRLTPWGREAALVALTGMGQQADIARTRDAGFDEHLTKPADLRQVSRLAGGAYHRVA